METKVDAVSEAVNDTAANEALSSQIAAVHEMLTDWRESEAAETETDPIIEYVVKRGDTLIEICNREGLDYYEIKSLLQELNSKDNLSMIEPGETLVLPMLPKK